MTHRFDKHPVDRKAVRDMIKARRWHEAINKELLRSGHKPEALMNEAIREAIRIGAIGNKTASVAHDVRKRGNEGRHKF